MNYRLKYFTLVAVSLLLLPSLPGRGNPTPTNNLISQTPTLVGEMSADNLFQQGVQQFRQGKYREALATYERVLEIRRQQKDKAGIAQTLNNLGQVYNGLQQLDKALEVLQQALTIRREIKDSAGEGETLDMIGGVYLGLFQDEKSLETLQQALIIRRQVKDRAGEAETLSRI